MKWQYILGVGLGCFAVGFFIYSQQSHKPVQSPAISDSASTTIKKAQLTALSADVSFATNAAPEAWQVVQTDIDVVDGNKIRTSSEGRAVIALKSDIVASLDNNTEIQLRLSDDQQQNRVVLAVGSIWNKIGRALEQDEVYEVYTPTMVAAVRGTSFGVSVIDGKEKIIVTDGIVAVRLLDQLTKESIQSSEILVKAGYTLELVSGKMVVRLTTDADKSNWYFEHNPLTATSTQPVIGVSETNPAPSGVTPAPAPASTSTPTPKVAAFTVTGVQPNRFTYDKSKRIAFSGGSLKAVSGVTFNGKAVEFYVTGVGILIVDAYNVPNQNAVYDVVLSGGGDTVTLPKAVQVIENVLPALAISQILSGYTTTQQEFVIVRGTGLSTVDSVLVNGVPADFTLNGNELHIPGATLRTVTKIQVSGQGQSATASP